MQAVLGAIERKTLLALKDGSWKGFEELSREAGIPLDSVRRAASWLKDKALAEISEHPEKILSISESGKIALEKGVSEKRLVQAIADAGGRAKLSELEQRLGLGKELNFALGLAKKNAWLSVHTGKELELELTGLEKQVLEEKYLPEQVLKKIEGKEELGEEEESIIAELKKRGLVEEKQSIKRSAKATELGLKTAAGLREEKGEINILTSKDLRERSWRGKGFREYNLQEPVPEIFAGKRHPYLQFLDNVRRKLTALGFKEMNSPTIVSEFYNFDVLFQPQHHSARTWTDTYALKQPKLGKLPDKKIVAKVKAAHENGAGTGSKGWGYKWSAEIASRLMPAAHGTAHSARQLVKGVEVPGKYFCIARCYRPDVVDSTHLSEFNQLEGIIIDKSLTFRSLLGILKQFAVEIAGAKKVKFGSAYFPFTEPSCELYIEHPKMGWVECGGAGIFRPEVTLTLGIKEPVIAWGLGVDRLAMIKLGIDDIRELFSKDLQWLRNTPVIDFS